MLTTIASSNKSLYHEGAVWLPKSKEIFVTSDRLRVKGSEKVKMHCVNIYTVVSREIMGKPEILMANGACIDGKDKIAVCYQGKDDINGGITLLDPYSGKNMDIIENIHNSPNDVVFNNEDTGFWFTDPSYGFDQGFRNKKVAPEAIYYSDAHGNVKMVYMEGDDSRPNGLAISPDGSILYYGETGRSKSVYSFSINKDFTLSSKKLLYTSKSGIPDGIKCDREGNLMIADGEGVVVISPDGVKKRVIEVEGGVVQLELCGDYLVLLCNKKLLKMKYY